jgi:uncharacterized ubiquitin-like protein YukD
MRVVPKFDEDLFAPDQRIVYFIRKPKRQRGFWIAHIKSVTETLDDVWITFDFDNVRAKVSDLKKGNYLLTWVFIAEAPEAQDVIEFDKDAKDRWVANKGKRQKIEDDMAEAEAEAKRQKTADGDGDKADGSAEDDAEDGEDGEPAAKKAKTTK